MITSSFCWMQLLLH